MKIPLSPPSDDKLFSISLKHKNIERIFKNSYVLHQGKYIHWDDLRRHALPDGMSLEEWWFAIRRSRNTLLKPLPLLLDKTGNPFQVATPEPVLIHLHHIDRDAAGQIKTPEGTPIQESGEKYLLHSLIEEAITSSQLEGASTTRHVAENMLREGRKPRDRSETMIFNNYLAMAHIRELKNEPMTPARILELHRMLADGAMDKPEEAGRLRQDNEIRVVDNKSARILHEPPHFEELPERLERLCAFANADQSATPFVHPAVRAILVHFMLGYDHPFSDGNGRTARALFYWSMARSGYWLTEFLSISEFLRNAPAQYGLAYLHTETDNNDATYFVLHQLNVIRRAIEALHDYLGRKAADQRKMETLLSSSPAIRALLNHRQIALLQHALKHPGAEYYVGAHQKTHGVVYQTARTDLLDLAARGVLTKAMRGRAFVFIAPHDLGKKLKETPLAP